MKQALIIPDCHIPYHDKKCYQAMLLAAQDLVLSEIVVLGDYADFYAVNSHGKHPEAQHLLIDEVDAVNQELDLLDSVFPDVPKIFIEGNHENRLERYLINNAPAIFGVTDINFLFQFNTRKNWTYIPYSKTQVYNIMGTRLCARHEPFSMSSAKASLNKCHTSLVYGHIHRREEYWTRNLLGEQLVNFSPGWLGDERNTKIFGYAFPNWKKGFALVHTDDGSGFNYSIIDFDNNKRCMVNGKVYGA